MNLRGAPALSQSSLLTHTLQSRKRRRQAPSPGVGFCYAGANCSVGSGFRSVRPYRSLRGSTGSCRIFFASLYEFQTIAQPLHRLNAGRTHGLHRLESFPELIRSAASLTLDTAVADKNLTDRDLHHPRRRPYPAGGEIYAIPYPVYYSDLPPDNADDAAQAQDGPEEYAPGPTIFDRRGSSQPSSTAEAAYAERMNETQTREVPVEQSEQASNRPPDSAADPAIGAPAQDVLADDFSFQRRPPA